MSYVPLITKLMIHFNKKINNSINPNQKDASVNLRLTDSQVYADKTVTMKLNLNRLKF